MSENDFSILTETQHNALLSGASMLIDELFMDYTSITKGETIKDLIVIPEYLPPQFRHYYDELFVKKFIVCVIRVVDRIGTWDEEEIPASTAECMALNAVIERAKVVIELENNNQDSKQNLEMDFDNFVEVAFPDLDFEILFDPSLDGFEDTEVAEEMDTALKPSEWFKPFYGTVHPYTE